MLVTSFFIKLFFIKQFDQIFAVKLLDRSKAYHLAIVFRIFEYMISVDRPIQGFRNPKDGYALASVERTLSMDAYHVRACNKLPN